MKNNKKRTVKSYYAALLWATKLFGRYASHTLEEKSRERIENWNPEDIPERFSASDEMLDEGCARVTDNVFSRLGFESEKKERKIVLPDNGKKMRRLLPAVYYRYAGVAVILIVATFTAMHFSDTFQGERKIMAEAGRKDLTVLLAQDDIRQCSLPDGTQLHINKGSKVSYNRNEFNHEKREVWLEGEVFFDVAKDAGRLFIIHNGNLQTVVRGTSFNVKAYQELEEMSIAVRTGKVEIRDNRKIIAELTPNEQLLYTKSDEKARESVINWQDASAWMEGKLVLQNAGIDELLLRIRQLYNTEITLDKDILKNERIAISFEKSAGFTDVISAICQLYDVQYKQTGPNQVTIYR